MEDRVVEVAPGKTDKPKCLVIRVAHPPDRPVWARVKPSLPVEAGQEHHFYTRAGKYTGIFWGVSQSWVDEQVTGMELVSLDAFKKAAGTIKIEKFELPEPKPGEARPTPPSERTNNEQTPSRRSVITRR